MKGRAPQIGKWKNPPKSRLTAGSFRGFRARQPRRPAPPRPRRRRLSPCAAGARARSRGEERGGDLLVEAEEVFDAFAVAAKGLGAVAPLHGVGFGQFGGHGERVVEIGQRAHPARGQMRFARGEHGAGGALHRRALRGGGGASFVL